MLDCINSNVCVACQAQNLLMHLLQVGNFRVEPPGLFRGRGEHPKMGKVKTRIYPRDITINIGWYHLLPQACDHMLFLVQAFKLGLLQLPTHQHDAVADKDWPPAALSSLVSIVVHAQVLLYRHVPNANKETSC